MAQEDKWVKDLVKELDKKTKEQLDPTYVTPDAKSNLIEPTLVESQAMVEHFRAGKLPWDVMKLVRRGNLTFSFEQINDALIAWQGVLTSKSPKSDIIKE
jgi:hypothetical protein